MSTKPTARFLDRTTPPHILTLILLVGLYALSMNIFLPSLPNMTEYFQTDYRLMQLSVALYLVVNAALQLVIGPLADRFGRRPIVLGGNILFLVMTVGCLLAPTAEVFLAFRMGQAVIVTGLVLSRAIVRDMVPGNEAASMIGYVTMFMAVVPMVSPAIGGFLDGLFGWQANFWLLLTLGVAMTWLCWRDLGETATQRSGGFARQFREYPELLTSPRFWGYSAAAAFASGAFFAYLGGAPFVGDQLFQMSPQRLGVFFGAPAVGYIFGNFLSGRYSSRIGLNKMALAGSLICTIGPASSLTLSLLGVHSPFVFFGFMVFVGIGNGLVMPNAAAGALSVRPHLAGTASGLSGAIMIGGGAALSAIAGALLTVETGEYPLLWIMVLTSVAGIITMLLVIRRERRLIRSGLIEE